MFERNSKVCKEFVRMNLMDITFLVEFEIMIVVVVVQGR